MKNIGSIIRMTAAALLFYFAVSCSIQAQEQAKNQVIFLENTSLDAGQAEEFCKKEIEQDNPVTVCFWGEKREVELVCQKTGKKSNVTLVAMTGNAKLISTEDEALNWQKNGCCIDTKTAEDLFGTSDPDGQVLRWNEREYTVCGSFPALNRTMICSAEKEDGQILNTISLQNSSSTSADAANQFMLRNNLTGEVVDFTFLNAFVKDFLLVLPLILLIHMIRLLLQADRQAYKSASRQTDKQANIQANIQAGNIGRKLLLWTMIIGMIAAFLWFASFWWTIPAQLIPSRWADMEFWNNWWVSQKRNLLTIFGTSLGETQLAMIWNLMKAVVLNVMAILLVPGEKTYR